MDCIVHIHGERGARAYNRVGPMGSGVASYEALGHVPPTSNNFIFFCLVWSKSDSQLSKYCVVCKISWWSCQQLIALSISTALVTNYYSHRAAAAHGHEVCCDRASLPNFQLCPSSQQILATPLGMGRRGWSPWSALPF